MTATNSKAMDEKGDGVHMRGVRALFTIALISFLLWEVVHFFMQDYAIQSEYRDTQSQCGALFGRAARSISERHHLNLSVGDLTAQRFVDRDGGPDTFVCRAKVTFGSDAVDWLASGSPGDGFVVTSAQVAGDDMSSEYWMLHGPKE